MIARMPLEAEKMKDDVGGSEYEIEA